MKGSGSVALLVIEASPIPAGAVKASGYEQDDQQSDEQADAQDGGHNGPDERPLRRVDQRRPEGHADPPRSPAVLGRIACQIYPLHLQRANQTRFLVTQLVEGVFAMVTTHATLAWRGSTCTSRDRTQQENQTHLSNLSIAFPGSNLTVCISVET